MYIPACIGEFMYSKIRERTYLYFHQMTNYCYSIDYFCSF